jgi:hypothetical protein
MPFYQKMVEAHRVLLSIGDKLVDLSKEAIKSGAQANCPSMLAKVTHKKSTNTHLSCWVTGLLVTRTAFCRIFIFFKTKRKNSRIFFISFYLSIMHSKFI